jgi:hypothetical protein
MSMSVSDDVHSSVFLVLYHSEGQGAYLELVLASLGGRAGVEEIDSENLVEEAVSIGPSSKKHVPKKRSAIDDVVAFPPFIKSPSLCK